MGYLLRLTYPKQVDMSSELREATVKKDDKTGKVTATFNPTVDKE